MCFVPRLQPLWSNPIAQSWLFTQYCEHSALKIACSVLHRSLQSEPPLLCRSDQCSQSSEAISSWLPRLHALVIGPGLGRDPTIMSTVKSVIAAAKQQQKDIVLDAVSWWGPRSQAPAQLPIACKWWEAGRGPGNEAGELAFLNDPPKLESKSGTHHLEQRLPSRPTSVQYISTNFIKFMG